MSHDKAEHQRKMQPIHNSITCKALVQIPKKEPKTITLDVSFLFPEDLTDEDLDYINLRLAEAQIWRELYWEFSK